MIIFVQQILDDGVDGGYVGGKVDGGFVVFYFGDFVFQC